jgi:GR25 family glycosyltransferase involved in LPS biosynthesis
MKRIVTFLAVLSLFLIVCIFIYFLKKKTTEENKIVIKEELNYLMKEIDAYNKKQSQTKLITTPVYYINMDIHTDRRKHIERQLDKYATYKQRISGFNGYAIKNQKNDTVDGITFINDYDGMKNAEIGCTLSHLIAIKTAYYNGDTIAIIVEDDTNINLIEMMDENIESIIEKAPLNYDIIKLFYMDTDRANKLVSYENPLLKNYSFLYEQEGQEYSTYSTVGYLINRKGMKKILDYVMISESTFHIKKENDTPYYGSADIFIYNLANTYNLYPSIFFPNNVSLQSTIHEDHTSAHISRSIELLKYYSNKIKELEFDNFPMHIVYINLDIRKDRDRDTKNELKKIKNKDISRISAIQKSNGAYGCLLSHYKAIEYSINYYPDQHVLVCEDDIEFLEDPCPVISDIVKKVNDWDVIMIAHNTLKDTPTSFNTINKVVDSQTGACYLIHSSYRIKLLTLFKKTIDDFELSGVWNNFKHCSDQCWKSLQRIDNWYIPSTSNGKRIAKQRKSYSNIENKIVDYLV